MITPLYEEAATLLNEGDEAVKANFADISCFDSGQFCSDLSITAYPSLRHYHGRNGLYDEYVGSKNIAEQLSKLTAGRVTLPENKPHNKPIASPIVPPPTRDVSLDDIYLTDGGLNAFVKLDMSGYPSRRAGYNSSVMLNFTISENRHHLLINNEPLALLVPNPSVPSRLRAQQIVSTSDGLHGDDRPTLQQWLTRHEVEQTLALDYQFTMNNRDDPSITYYSYYPILQLNIIGARTLHIQDTGDDQTHHLLHGTGGQQKIVEVRMHEQNHASSTSSNRNFTITEVKLIDRPRRYEQPQGPRPCGLTSWRCADIADPPWYNEVWYDHFDEHGRVGCLRREVLLWWKSLRPTVLYLLCPSWVLVVAWKAWRGYLRRAMRLRDISAKKGILS